MLIDDILEGDLQPTDSSAFIGEKGPGDNMGSLLLLQSLALQSNMGWRPLDTHQYGLDIITSQFILCLILNICSGKLPRWAQWVTGAHALCLAWHSMVHVLLSYPVNKDTEGIEGGEGRGTQIRKIRCCFLCFFKCYFVSYCCKVHVTHDVYMYVHVCKQSNQLEKKKGGLDRVLVILQK